MIITEIAAGLGNQMFRYAAGLALAEKLGTVQKLDVGWYSHDQADDVSHERYALSCFNITEQFASEEEARRLRGISLSRPERWSLALARRLRLHQYVRRMESGRHYYRQPTFGYHPDFFDLPDFSYLSGFWQSELYFLPVADLLRLHFTFRYPAPPAVVEMAKRIQDGPSAFIHFRRGDYRSAKMKNLGIPSGDYYDRALDFLYEKHPGVTLYVFSDVIDEVEKEFKPRGPHVFMRATEPWHSYDDMRLMSFCQHAVIANSTFSWWGAWLMKNPSKLVIAPDPWLLDPSVDSSRVVPDSWVRLPGRHT